MQAFRLLIVAVVVAGGVLHAPAPASAGAGACRPLWIHNVHTGDTLRVRPFGRLGRPAPRAWRAVNRLFRSWRTDQRRTIHPRLLRVLLRVQQHFGGRRIELVSGYRVPENADALSSYHQVGRAADIRIEGVDKRALFEYCRRLQATEPLGCGYYPNTSFVHIDVRGTSGLWVDLSASGEGRDYVPDPLAWLRRLRR